MAAVTSPTRHAGSLATSASNRERHQSKVHRAMEWPKPSSVRSNVTMFASVRARMHRPSCTSSQLGLITTTRFTRTRHSDIVHPVSLSQLAEARDRVRSFGGYNTPTIHGFHSRTTQPLESHWLHLVMAITTKRFSARCSNPTDRSSDCHPGCESTSHKNQKREP